MVASGQDRATRVSAFPLLDVAGTLLLRMVYTIKLGKRSPEQHCRHRRHHTAITVAVTVVITIADIAMTIAKPRRQLTVCLFLAGDPHGL